MNWYLAKMIFQIICGKGDHTPQFDEQLRLVEAANDEQAWEMATELGKKESVCFPNQQQQMVEWKFINIPELYRISELMHGAELFSRIHETDNAEAYLDLVNNRAQFMRQHQQNVHIQLL